MSSPSPRQGRQPGFSLVELLMAALVMVISTIGGTTLFNQATRHGLLVDQRLHQQFAISDDLAAILEVNERYTCRTGLCDASLPAPVNGVLPPPPDQDHYAPADIDVVAPGATRSFRQLCSEGLLTNLLTALGSKDLGNTHVHRSVSLVDASSTTGLSIVPHRYRVDWKDDDGKLLRQVQLIPTVAAWCP